MTSASTEARPAASAASRRGDLRITARMEMLQDGYLRAIASAAGCTMAKPDPDDGIDWVLTHRSPLHTVDSEVDLKVQLKSTHQIGPNPDTGYVSISLANEKFNQLARMPVTINRILIAMIVPKDVEKWVDASHDCLSLRHCAYWFSLAGKVASAKTKSTTVRVPTRQVFDDIALCEIMERIGNGGRP